MQHDLQVTAEHFEKAVQNPVQQMHESPGDVSQAENGENAELLDLPGFAVSFDSERTCGVDVAGLEPATSTMST